MKLHDLFEPYEILHLNEVFDTKIPVNKWRSQGRTLTGELNIDNAVYHISLEPSTYKFQTKIYNFINITFAKIVNGEPIQTLTFDKENPANASKVIGAIVNALYDKLTGYQYHAIVMAAMDNVQQRMRIYDSVARWKGAKLGASVLYDIPLLKGGKATIIFDKNFDREAHDDFVKFVSTLKK